MLRFLDFVYTSGMTDFATPAEQRAFQSKVRMAILKIKKKEQEKSKKDTEDDKKKKKKKEKKEEKDSIEKIDTETIKAQVASGLAAKNDIISLARRKGEEELIRVYFDAISCREEDRPTFDDWQKVIPVG
jgi:phosphomannomutase